MDPRSAEEVRKAKAEVNKFKQELAQLFNMYKEKEAEAEETEAANDRLQAQLGRLENENQSLRAASESSSARRASVSLPAALSPVATQTSLPSSPIDAVKFHLSPSAQRDTRKPAPVSHHPHEEDFEEEEAKEINPRTLQQTGVAYQQLCCSDNANDADGADTASTTSSEYLAYYRNFTRPANADEPDLSSVTQLQHEDGYEQGDSVTPDAIRLVEFTTPPPEGAENTEPSWAASEVHIAAAAEGSADGVYYPLTKTRLERMEAAERRRAEVKRELEKEMTFHPTINRAPPRRRDVDLSYVEQDGHVSTANSPRRPGSPHVESSRQNGEQQSVRSASASTAATRQDTRVFQRLFTDDLEKRRVVSAERTSRVREAEQVKAAEEEAECTFTPMVSGRTPTTSPRRLTRSQQDRVNQRVYDVGMRKRAQAHELARQAEVLQKGNHQPALSSARPPTGKFAKNNNQPIHEHLMKLGKEKTTPAKKLAAEPEEDSPNKKPPIRMTPAKKQKLFSRLYNQTTATTRRPEKTEEPASTPRKNGKKKKSESSEPQPATSAAATAPTEEQQQQQPSPSPKESSETKEEPPSTSST